MKAFAVKPTEVQLFMCFIALYSHWGKKEKVEEYFKKGLEIQPTNPNTYNAMSTYYLSRGEFEEAKKMAQKALNIDPQFTLSLLNLIEIFMMSGEADSTLYYLNEFVRRYPKRELFVEQGYLELMRENKEQAEIYFDSCIQFNQRLAEEFENSLGEYIGRSRMALAYALKGESRNALEQADRVKKSLGEHPLCVGWAFGPLVVRPLSFVYSLTGQKEEAVRMLDPLVKNNIMTPAYIKSHPWYKNLTGYPAFEELIKGKL
jgi:tetratricopeptide (TPR) repeat protein